MKKLLFKYSLILSLLSFPFFQSKAQCTIDFDVPAVAGIYPDTLFDAKGCEFYEETITFVLARDTVVSILPGQEVTVPFNSYTITDILGLPAGMSWECNLDSVGCFYDVNPNNAAPDTLGCVRLFGTPETPGFYAISVVVIANLAIVGDQQGTFDINLAVLPCVINSDCYTFALSDICTPSRLELTNNVASNGVNGFEYVWEIEGPNGYSFRSEAENPAAQILEAGGEYIITYEANIDTVGTILAEAIIETVNCSDLLSAGDIYWILQDTTGNEWINSSASPLNNAGNDTPIVTNIDAIVLPEGVYQFQVWDSDDTILDRKDDGCADGANDGASAVDFRIPLVDSLMMGDTLRLTNGGLTVSLLFSRPTSIFRCLDTFFVSATPPVPEMLAIGDLVICEGDSTVLETALADSLQWFRDGVPLVVEQSDRILVRESGVYQLQSINPMSGCASMSEPIEIEVVSLATPEISFDGDLELSILNPDSSLEYQWIKLGEGVIASGEILSLSSSGVYQVLAIEPASGCESLLSDSLAVILTSLRPDFVDFWNIYPNPNQGQFKLGLQLSRQSYVKLKVLDVFGHAVYHKSYPQAVLSIDESLSLHNLAKGVYFIYLELEGGILSKKVVIQ